jgi:Uma2 family endonuclease
MAVANPARALLTADEFYRLPDSEGKQELVRGEVIEMAPAGGEHGGVATRFIVRLDRAVAQGSGYALPETGFRLFRDPDTVRAPDASYVSASRLPDGRLPTKFIEGPPDIAVEVVSPDDTAREVAEKVQEYLSSGCPLVLVADPRPRTVAVHRPGEAVRVLRGQDVVSAEDLLPGFAVTVDELFR